jgi:hypothetical protein
MVILDRELTRFLLWLQVLSAPSLGPSADSPGWTATSTSFPSRGDEPERAPLAGSAEIKDPPAVPPAMEDKRLKAAINVAFRSNVRQVESSREKGQPESFGKDRR